MPKVSVLLTCYNHLEFLGPCVDSIRGQTLGDFEVIAIDDGSSDGTREWLLSQPDLKILFNESNLGTYASLNRGLAECAGEYVAILNDDDLWAPEKLRAQVELMESDPSIGLCHTDGWFIDGQGNRLEGSPLGFEFPRTLKGNVLTALLYANKIIASAALVRRECFERLGGFNEEYFGSGDWEMWLRIAAAYPVGYVDLPLTFYRVHGANASHKLERIWQDDERLRKWIRSQYASYGQMGLDGHDLRNAMAHNEACLGTVCKLNGKPAEARRAYARSIRMSPGRWKSYVRWLATYFPAGVFRRLG